MFRFAVLCFGQHKLYLNIKFVDILRCRVLHTQSVANAIEVSGGLLRCAEQGKHHTPDTKLREVPFFYRLTGLVFMAQLYNDKDDQWRYRRHWTKSISCRTGHVS